jgi:hypothetical protein
VRTGDCELGWRLCAKPHELPESDPDAGCLPPSRGRFYAKVPRGHELVATKQQRTAPHTSTDWSREPDLEWVRRANALYRSDPAAGLQEYTALAEKGSIYGMIHTGYCLSVGEGVPRDIEAGAIWFRKAMELGSVEGAYRLARYYLFKGDMSAARQALEFGVARDFVPALNTLGDMYARGYLGAKDFDQARALWQRASDLGQLNARVHLAKLFISGRYGVVKIIDGIRLYLSAMVGVLKIADPNRRTDLIRR